MPAVKTSQEHMRAFAKVLTFWKAQLCGHGIIPWRNLAVVAQKCSEWWCAIRIRVDEVVPRHVEKDASIQFDSKRRDCFKVYRVVLALYQIFDRETLGDGYPVAVCKKKNYEEEFAISINVPATYLR